MKEELISFKTAKLAKEKGFDIPCSLCCSEDYKLPTPFNVGNEYHVNSKHPYLSVTTQSLLQKWLFDKYHINIELSFDDGQWLIYVGKFSYPDSSVQCVGSIETFSFTEAMKKRSEALEIGLQEALNII